MFGGTGYLGFDGIMPQRQPALQPAQPPMQQQPVQQPSHGGMFGGKVQIDLGRALAGYLAGIGNPAGAQTLQAMNEDRRQRIQHQQQLDDYNRTRADKQADFISQYDYELAHPKPTNNDTVADYDFWKSKLTPEQFQQYVENKVNPPQLMNIPGVGVVQVPRQASPAIPTAPVGALKPYNPGGPTQPASGGFPR